MKVRIMFRNDYTGGDGWISFPMDVDIADNCPVCGEQRGESYPEHIYENGDWFTVDAWDNPCGHIDTYRDCFHESLTIQLRAINPTAKDVL